MDLQLPQNLLQIYVQLPPKLKVLGWAQTKQIINMVSVRIPQAALVTQTLKEWHKLQRAWEQG